VFFSIGYSTEAVTQLYRIPLDVPLVFWIT